LKSNDNGPHFCLEIWGTDYNKIKDTCFLAEKLGYNGFFYGESLSDIDLDCWTVLSNLSALTTKIKLGPVITYLLPQYRSIALLAKQAVTLQEISDGRLEFRTGVGAIPKWASQWWHPYGIEYPSNVQRACMLDEGIFLLRKLWKYDSDDELSVHFSGKYFKLNGAPSMKPSKTIPITIAAMKRKTMQIANKYADVWESSYLTPDQLAALNKKFEGLKYNSNENGKHDCVGGKLIKKSIELDVLIADSNTDLEHKKRIFVSERGSATAQMIFKYGLVGRPYGVAERLRKYIDVGIDQFFLAFQDPFDSDALELFTEAFRQ
jgi:alkanesulfonate monooxygenase SsuD/methylene tetrahydromethanopterin reductase-like flavin-dependent oxidoreductase (luciferase family)